MTKLDELRAKLAASTGPDGKPKAGYKRRAIALQSELVRLEAGTTARNTNPMNPVG